MEEFFGVVFYNPPIIGKAVYTLLDYTHNINRAGESIFVATELRAIL